VVASIGPSASGIVSFPPRAVSQSFASAGAGSSDHLTAELFWQQTGTTGVHVPYKGGGPAHTDLMGGQVDASFQNINAVLQYIRAGRMRPLAITSVKRSPLLPDVPTLAEAGVKGVEVTSWQAIVAPKGLPPAVREKAHAAFAEALQDPRVKDQFTAIGFEMVVNTPAQFASFMQAESARWKTVIEAGKISLD
jgi:tripartite-type tricarboxylate transporter receptor subunit TctC